MPEEQISEVEGGMGDGKIVHHPSLTQPEGWISPSDDQIADMVSKAGESMLGSQLKGTQGMSHEAKGVEMPSIQLQPED
jgi:hypothetical protein